MRLNDEERAEARNLLELSRMAMVASMPGEWHDGHATLAGLLERLLARDAERTQPVTAEWLDGPEGKRLGFERDAHDEWLWCAKADGSSSASVQASVQVLLPGPGLWVADWNSSEEVVGRRLHGNATIAQVRDAVRLLTGRE